MAEKVKAIKLADGTVTNLVDKKTKLSVNYRPVTTYYDGSAMTNAKVDGDLYIKNGTTFYRKVIDKDGELFLEKDTMAQMRALTAFEILLLKAGVYKGVKLNGYYMKGDTPSPIEYILSATSEADDGGSVIITGSIKLEHKFSGEVDISYFGASPAQSDNSVFINAIYLKYDSIVASLGVYKFTNSINITSKPLVNIRMINGSEFLSEVKTDDGIYPTKILNINSCGIVNIKGIFDGGYYVGETPQGVPKSSVKNSALIYIRSCSNVDLEINVKNTCSNWSPTSTLENLLDYGIVYVRECVDVRCANSSLTTSRVEGFIFLGNYKVVVRGFKSKENISIWTPLHLFLNNYVTVEDIYLDQFSSQNGSTLNLYNNYSTINNSQIRYGQGIDHSWEISGVDISGFNIVPKNIVISNNDFFGTKNIFYSIYHTDELPKDNVEVIGNYYRTDASTPLSTPAGLIRIDASKFVKISRNTVDTVVEGQSLFQSVGGIDLLYIDGNIGKVDSTARLTQAAGEVYNYGDVYVKNNNVKSIPLNSRNASLGASSLVFINNISKIKSIDIEKNIISGAEGRVVQVVGSSSELIPELNIIRNISKDKSDVFLSITNVGNLLLDGNRSKNSRVYSSLSNINGDLTIINNYEKSDTSKTTGMFNSISGTINKFTFYKNEYDVPNPTAYGIINNVSGVLSVVSKNVYDNTPEVHSSKTIVAPVISGWKSSGVLATTSQKGLVNQSAFQSDITAVDVAGVVAWINQFMAKYRSSGQGASS